MAQLPHSIRTKLKQLRCPPEEVDSIDVTLLAPAAVKALASEGVRTEATVKAEADEKVRVAEAKRAEEIRVSFEADRLAHVSKPHESAPVHVEPPKGHR